MKKIFSVCLLGLFMATTFSASAQYTNQKMKVGDQAPELAFESPNGDTVSLNKIIKGRYVLLDFWASWCRPCRMANPALVDLYNKLKNKKFKDAKHGFTIVSFSLDREKANWKKAINDDKLSWPYHMSDLQAWRSKGAELYGVMFIPQSFLIAPDGKIIAMYDPSNDLTKNLEKDLEKYMK